MPINMGLGRTQAKAYRDLQVSHHRLEVLIQILDLNHKAVGGPLAGRLIDGQVTVDADSSVTRGVEVDLMDPTGALHLDSKSPDDGAMFADRMVQIRYSIINPRATQRFTCPIFTGPISRLERSGAIVKVQAQGKEVFGLKPVWNERTFKKGAKITSVIRYILTEMMGESLSKISVPDLGRLLPRNVSVGEDRLPWQVAKSLARSIGYQLFYDGAGVCRMRRLPSRSAYTFRDGQGGSVKTEPDAGFSIDQVINAVEVWGKKPKKRKGRTAKKRPHARAVAPRSHPLSPWALGRTGGPRYLPLVIEDDGISTMAEAKARAKKELAAALLESMSVAYDTIPIADLQEMDIVTCKTEKFSSRHRLKQFTIPLTSTGSMTVGYVRNVKPNRNRIRVKTKSVKPKPRRS